MASDTVPVDITFDHPGSVPPIFVAGSFTDPAWEPVELKPQESRQWSFNKTFHIRPGTYQYKFRLGIGDWWILDESQQKGTDGSGNVNNVLVVKALKMIEEAKSQPEMPLTNGGEKTNGYVSNPAKFGLDGSHDSDADESASLVRACAAAENTMAEFPSASADIEPMEPENIASTPCPTAPEVVVNGHANGPIAPALQSEDCVGGSGAAAGHQDVSAAAMALPNEMSDRLSAEDDGVEVESEVVGGSQSSLVNNEDGNDGSLLTFFCRAIFGGIMGTISSARCGRRRKIAVILTLVLIPILAAWKLQG